MTYCDRDCQRENWLRIHKLHCRFLEGRKQINNSEHNPSTCALCFESRHSSAQEISNINSPKTACAMEDVIGGMKHRMARAFRFHTFGCSAKSDWPVWRSAKMIQDFTLSNNCLKMIYPTTKTLPLLLQTIYFLNSKTGLNSCRTLLSSFFLVVFAAKPAITRWRENFRQVFAKIKSVVTIQSGLQTLEKTDPVMSTAHSLKTQPVSEGARKNVNYTNHY